MCQRGPFDVGGEGGHIGTELAPHFRPETGVYGFAVYQDAVQVEQGGAAVVCLS